MAAKTVKFVELAGGFPATKKVSERHCAVNNASQSVPVSLFDLGPEQAELRKFTDDEAQRRFIQG